MKNTKIKERFENAIDAFFDDAKLNDDLSKLDYSNFYETNENSGFRESHQRFISILKQVFLFSPGAFVLFFMTLAFTALVITHPINIQTRFGFIPTLLIYLFSFLLTWLGLGNLRKPKTAIIPSSLIVSGIFFGIVCGLLSLISPWLDKLLSRDNWIIILLPIALTVPFLVKGWIDRKSEDA